MRWSSREYQPHLRPVGTFLKITGMARLDLGAVIVAFSDRTFAMCHLETRSRRSSKPSRYSKGMLTEILAVLRQPCQQDGVGMHRIAMVSLRHITPCVSPSRS